MSHMHSLVRPLIVMAIAALLLPLRPPASQAQNADNPSEYRVLQNTPDRLLVELPNRMIILAQELRTAPVVSAQVWVKTGSIYEQEHVGAGLSHYLEHLLSGGTTTNRTEAESNAILGRIGAETNAATSLDTVRYYINTTSNHAHEAIDLLSDWMRNSVIREEEFQRERDVIFREFEMGQGEPDRIFWKLTQQARYKAHPARHPTIGYIDEFRKITRQEITDFYHRMYVPNNMVFVVAGDIDKQKVVDQITKLWADAKPRDLPKLSFPVEPQVDTPRQLAGSASIGRPRLRLAWPGTKLASPGDFELDLLGVILGQGESSRLVREVRDKAGAVTTIDAYNASFPWGEGFFGVDAEVAVPELDAAAGDGDIAAARANAINRAKELILREIARLKAEGVTDQELAAAKRQTIARVVYQGQTAQGMAARLAQDLIGMADPDYLTRYAEKVQAITKQDVMAAADRFLNTGRLITITLRPAPADAKPAPLVRPSEDKANDGLERKPFTLDNIVLLDKLRATTAAGQARQIQTDPVQMITLDNGLRVVIGRSTAVPAVAVQLFQLGGLLSDEPGRQGVANATATMQMRGTKTRTAQQIAQTVEHLGASLDTQCGNNSNFAAAVCLKDDLPTIMELLADVTLNPTFPEEEWAKMRPRLVAAIDRRVDTWHGELSERFRRAYYDDNPWATSPLGRADIVASLTADDLRKFHADHLGANETVLAVFGDVDVDQVKALAEKHLGSMPAKPKVAFKLPDYDAPQGRLEQHQTTKPLAAVVIGFAPGAVRSSDDYPALQVLSQVMGTFPSGWLPQELRGRGPGLVYAVGCYQFTGLQPGYFAILFNTDPEKAPQAYARAMAVAERARTRPIEEHDLARAKARVLTSEFMGKQSNSDRATDAALNVLYGLGLDEPQNFLTAVESLDSSDLQAAAQKYLRDAVTIVLTHRPIPDEAMENALDAQPQTSNEAEPATK